MQQLPSYTNEFEKLFKDNYNSYIYYALGFVKNEEDAKDIVSSIFEYVWNNYESLKTETSLNPLIYTLLRNKCIDHIRHQNTKINYQNKLLSKGIPFEELKFQELDETTFIVKEILNKLPDRMKDVVTKIFIEGKKYKEVSEEMGISVNTVKTHVTRALTTFRENLKDI